MFANERRGLRILGTNFVYLTEGFYAVIFVDRKQGRVRKVYRASKKLDHWREVFESEIDAYQKASKANDLKDLVSAFFGMVCCQNIVDSGGNDVSAEFYPELSFETEYVPHRFDKIAAAPVAERSRVTSLQLRRCTLEYLHRVRQTGV
jgi:hypothetical protein